MTAPSQWSQHSQRVSEDPNHSGKFFRDQHGREWHAEVEIRTGDPCGPLSLVVPRGAPRAPYIPDSNYITIVKGRRGDKRVDFDIEINYPKLRENIAEGWAMYQSEVARQKVNNPHLSEQELVRKVGKPTISPRIIDLMESGDEYLLGLRPFDPTNAVDRWAKEMVNPDRKRTFVDPDDGFPLDPDAVVVPQPKRRGRPPKVQPDEPVTA